jgi:hypothetical protein
MPTVKSAVAKSHAVNATAEIATIAMTTAKSLIVLFIVVSPICFKILSYLYCFIIIKKGTHHYDKSLSIQIDIQKRS